MKKTLTKRKLLTTIVAAGGILALLASPAAAAHEGTAYEADLKELNNSGGSGTATLTVSEDGNTMDITLNATGLNLDGPHAQHIHGVVSGDALAASSCPTMADDADGDGVLTVVEGIPRYGGVQVSLTTEGDTSADSALAVERFPTGNSISYTRTGVPIPENLKADIGKLHFVVHGIDENGNGTLDMDQVERSSLDEALPREATAPALCGTLTAVTEGPVQTGAGGLAGNESNLPAAGAAALVGAAAIAYGTRRETSSI